MRQGISLDWQTFINLIPQQIPQFLADLIGFQRPLSDPWILMKYVFHGGGFYIFAEAYWNGGILPLSIFTFVITYIIIKLEIFFKKHDVAYYLAYPIFLFLIPVNNFYGILPLIRGIEYGLIALFLIYLYKKIRIRRRIWK